MSKKHEKHIDVDREKDDVKQFVRSLAATPSEVILDFDGQPQVSVTPVSLTSVDDDKVKADILKRRDQSRRLNKDWENVDREVWDRETPDHA